VTTQQTEFTEAELLASLPVAEPLIAGGARCHGGFADDGTYVSPRTANRWPAIRAWQAQHAEQFDKPLLDVGLDTWPGAYPNVAQSRFLIEQHVERPIIDTLTRIGTVEGFGAVIRDLTIPDLKRCFIEDVRGTAMDHLSRGLFEAHGRDEAGFGAEGGHKQMWFAARDVAFENPSVGDETALMLQRLARAPVARLFPDDIDPDLEPLVDFMVRLLLIEVSAHHTFAWAEELLSLNGLVAGDGEAARLVSYIRTDESPHVEYLRTTLSEMRDRTFVGTSGRTYPGADLIGRLWDRALSDSLGPRRQLQKQTTIAEVERAVNGRADGGDLLEEFHRLAGELPEARAGEA
jgi:hypothetical protein